jgi:hypothetical protein
LRPALTIGLVLASGMFVRKQKSVIRVDEAFLTLIKNIRDQVQ